MNLHERADDIETMARTGREVVSLLGERLFQDCFAQTITTHTLRLMVEHGWPFAWAAAAALLEMRIVLLLLEDPK